MTASDRPIIVLVVGAGRQLDVRAAQADYRVFNTFVGGPQGPGSISMLRLPGALVVQGFAAYCDDDAVARNQALNHFRTHLGHHILRGPVVFFHSGDEGNEESLSDTEIRSLVRYFAGPPSEEAVAQAEADRQFWETNPSGMAFKAFDSIDELFKDLGSE